MIGRTLGPYEITGKIGEGGMGEVYRARDAKLDREVALKILPRELSGDRERSARFEREARTLASLQHANIASIYDYEEIEGVRFLAMELVEGIDLAERLDQGPLPIGEAMGIALQIAIGLEAAHERNIIHRDLKPANIKIAPDGAVKILDFGLARAYTGDPEDQSNPALSPTITAAMTQAGTILGTAAYMSPEQARGRNVDKRSDIWAFGVILFEMFTGKRLYDGETVTDILGAIVHGRPDLDLLPPKVPARVRALLERCLTPELPDRLRDIGEARIVLSSPGGAGPAATAAGSGGRRWQILAAALTAVVIALGFVLWSSEAPPPRILQTTVDIPEDHVVVSSGLRGGSVRVSPDGQSIAFIAQHEGRQQIWIRSLSELEGRAIPGTEGGHRPFWSPDSRSIAFFAGGNLRRVSVTGGAPLTIASASNGRGGVWLESGEIVFAPGPNASLYAVPAGGGQPREVTDKGSRSHREPRWLPLEGRFLFLDNVGGGQWAMCVGSLDGGPHVELGRSSGGLEYADGHLLYLQGRTLVARPFDLGKLEFSGEPAPVAERVVRDPNFGIGMFSAAEGGVLCYQAGTVGGARILITDREGDTLATLGEEADYEQISLSQDGRTLGVVVGDVDGKSDIWFIDVERNTQRRFTFTPEGSAVRRGEIRWSSDGKFIIYAVETDTATSIAIQRTDGSGREETLYAIPGENIWPYSLSPDDQWVVYGRQTDGGNEDLWLLPVSGDKEPTPLFQTPYDEWPASISPDGRWIAVDSDETGRREIYVLPFPTGNGRWPVSRDGGRYPEWSADGTELFYMGLDGTLMVVSVTADGEVFRTSEPQVLLKLPFATSAYSSYDVDPSGERFIFIEQGEQYSPISLFLHWDEALRGR